MILIASAVESSWLRAEAARRCESSREGAEEAIAMLRTLDAECAWRARGVEQLRKGLGEQQQELTGLLTQLQSIATSLATR